MWCKLILNLRFASNWLLVNYIWCTGEYLLQAHLYKKQAILRSRLKWLLNISHGKFFTRKIETWGQLKMSKYKRTILACARSDRFQNQPILKSKRKLYTENSQVKRKINYVYKVLFIKASWLHNFHPLSFC